MNSHLLPLFISFRSSGEKLIKYQANSSCVIMSVILTTTLFQKALLWQGEIWCWSLLALKGLNDVSFLCLVPVRRYHSSMWRFVPREWYNDYWQLTFCNLTFWLVRFLNKQGEDFGQKICLLACAIAKTMNTKGFLCFPTCESLDEIPPWSHSQENSLVELPCETICVTIVYKRKWNISRILA